MRMKKSIFILGIILIALNLDAQFMAQYMHSNPFKFSMQDFNKIVINNVGSKAENAKVVYALKDEKSNIVCEINFGVVQLNQGSNRLNYAQGSLKWLNTPYREQLMMDRMISGNFQVCVGIADFAELVPSLDDCFDVELKSEEMENPLGVRPIELNTPNDKDTIEEKRPLLTWIPPSPVYQGTLYHLTLTEKTNKQTCIESLNNNVPILDKKSIQPNILNYPVEAPDLVEGKTYCWRVAAYANDKEYTRSEEWGFVVKPNKDNQKSIPVINEIDNYIVYPVNDKFEFALNIKQNIPELIYEVLDFNNLKVISNESDKIKLIIGMNLLSIDTRGIKNGIYTIHIKNIDNRNYEFQIKK